MKQFTCTLFLAIASLTSQAQVNFENLNIDTSFHYWKGNPGVPGLTDFQSGGAHFINQNDTSSIGDYWSGWAYSNKKDTSSISYANNDCASIAGGGHLSDQYGVAYISFNPAFNIIKLPPHSNQIDLYVSNTTIAYRSMQNGDGFAKKFGGLTGNDPDFFRLDFTGWFQGNPISDTVHFYLADFRDSINTNDYILKDWAHVNLHNLGPMDSITYFLVSSDTNAFGPKTPLYFCLDDLNYVPETIANLEENKLIEQYPNPCTQEFMLRNSSNKIFTFDIISMQGAVVLTGELKANETKKIVSRTWTRGNYTIRFNDGQSLSYKRFVR